MGTTQPTLLVINAGSSSLKYELFAMEPQHSLFEGSVEGIETGGATGATGLEQAIQTALDGLAETGALEEGCELVAIGHRIVHGGERFAGAVVLDDEVVGHIREQARFAPLHIEANLAAVAAARSRCPDVPHVGVFDTAFHRTLPPHAREYAIPRSLAREHSIRRYGFHGTSHAYVARDAAELLGRPLEELKLITLHLGNGASVAAIRGGESIDTSMGMTPLEGLVMGTRCGDVDPSVPLLLAREMGGDASEVDRILNEESGLLGVCGTRDMREVQERAAEDDADAKLAIEMFCYRAKKYIGAYLAALGGADAIVFTAGIGENDADVRARICAGLEPLGITIDEAANAKADAQPRTVSAERSTVAALVVPTDEEFEIARLAYECVTRG